MRKYVLVGIIAAWLLHPQTCKAQIAVRHQEGLARGFLTLSSMHGEILADGEQTQTIRGNQVTTRLVFRFKDGSIHDETTVFSQQRNLKLISDHLIQKGPAFKQSIDVSVIAGSGDGKEKNLSDHLQLPGDVANGIVLTF